MHKLTDTKFTRRLIATIALVLVSSPAFAGDAMAGKEKSAACVACHGEDGNSPNAAYPRLAGQYASYLEHALQAYRSGARENAIMKGFAEPLSDEDIEDLAAFFASQEGDLHAINPD